MISIDLLGPPRRSTSRCARENNELPHLIAFYSVLSGLAVLMALSPAPTATCIVFNDEYVRWPLVLLDLQPDHLLRLSV